VDYILIWLLLLLLPRLWWSPVDPWRSQGGGRFRLLVFYA